jgi:hypothetical protein
MQQQKPSVGRDVHYVSHGTPGGEYPSVCRAAKITALEPGLPRIDRDRVSLCVFNPEGLHFPQHIGQDEDGKLGGTWHWPERVD